MRHAQQDALPVAPAQAACSNGRLGLATKSLSDFPSCRRTSSSFGRKGTGSASRRAAESR